MSAPRPSAPSPAPARAATAPPRRRWLRRGGAFAGLATLLLAALLVWLLATVGGRDTLLARIVAMLPPGATLSWTRADGVLHGPLVLHGVRYRQPDGLEFRSERLLLDPDLLPAFGRRLQLDRLEVDAATLQLPPAADEPFALPTWPESLPTLPMPIDIRTTTLTVDGLRVSRDDTLLIDIRTLAAAGVHLVDDGFALDSATLTSDRGDLTLRGEYRPAQSFGSDLVATLAFPAAAGAIPATLQLTAKGNLDALDVAITGNAPQPLRVRSALRDGRGAAPTWTLQAQSEGLDPALFSPPAAATAATEPWRFLLDASGTGGAAKLHGDVARGDWQATIQPSRLRLEDGRLHAEPLALTLPQGPLQLVGDLQVAGDDAAFDVRIASAGLRLAPTSSDAGAMPVQLAGEARVHGTVDAWTLEGNTTAQRDGAAATLQLHGVGDRTQLRVDTLHADTPTGTLDGSGFWRWSPQAAFALDARLAGFDPGYFFADFPGALSGKVSVQGDQDAAGGWRGHGTLDDLGGELRGRTVAGHARAEWNGDAGRGDADLRVGASVLRANGGFGARYDLRIDAAPLHLDDLLPDAHGQVAGHLVLRGPAAAPDIEADLRGGELAWGAYRARLLSLAGTLPAAGNSGRFAVQAGDLQIDDVVFERLALQGDGSRRQMSLRGEATGAPGQVVFAGALGGDGGGWRGRVDTLRLAPAQGPALQLEAPAAFAYAIPRWQFDRACFAVIDAGGRLCAAADGDRLTVDGEALPLSLLQPWLPADTGVAMQAYGTLALQARLQRDGGGRWSGDARVDSASGGLRLADDAEREVFGYRDLAVRLTLVDNALDGSLQARLADDGQVSAQLRTGLAADAPLAGQLRLDVRDLTWLELFSEDVAAPVGRLDGTLQIAGTRAAPALSGSARLAGFAAELPGLGIKLQQGTFDLVGAADGTVRVVGQVTSGDGVLHLDGSLDATDPTAPLVLALKGDQVTLASTPELYAIADPDLTLRWLDDRLEVRGSLKVSEARIDLEALDSSVATSPDVVVVDPLDGAQERGKPLDLQFAVTLGDDVRLKGFGLDGRIAGVLTLRERPGRRATASGTLQVSGKYRAYGQALDITHARLGYADSPYDDPTLDIRAERRFDRVVVGVQVRGSARRPQTNVISSPAMETSEALSWLVFGRPLRTTTSGESQQLGAAAIALGAGGNLIAQQVGARLGLDEAGVVESRNLGGATFTVGKYVSPRLFLSYGVSLIGTGQVVTLKYLLTRDFDISVESGAESAASINWRREK